MELSLSLSLLLIGTSFFASAISATLGLGGGPLMIAILGSFLPIPALVPLHASLMVGATSSRAWFFRQHIDWKIVRPFGVGVALGVAVGATLYVSLPDTFVAIGIGTLMLVSAWFPETKWRPRMRHPFFFVGVVQAVLSSLFGMGGLMQALIVRTGLSKLQITGTMGAAFIAMNLCKMTAFSLLGFAYQPFVLVILLSILVSIPGSWLGRRLVNLISEDQFRLSYKLILTIGGLRLLYRAVQL